MSDRLALLVGKVILAWGILDQQLFATIRAMEDTLGLPHPKEGRFNERRKMYRRLAVKLADDDAFMRQIDAFCGELQALERKRGQIAHGWATSNAEGATFHDFPEGTEGPSNSHPFSFEDLYQLKLDIRSAKAAIVWHHAAALKLVAEREGRPTPVRLGKNRKLYLRFPPRRSKPSDRGKEKS